MGAPSRRTSVCSPAIPLNETVWRAPPAPYSRTKSPGASRRITPSVDPFIISIDSRESWVTREGERLIATGLPVAVTTTSLIGNVFALSGRTCGSA